MKVKVINSSNSTSPDHEYELGISDIIEEVVCRWSHMNSEDSTNEKITRVCNFLGALTEMLVEKKLISVQKLEQYLEDNSNFNQICISID